MNRYRNCLLSLLTVILAFNYIDRLALGLVLQDIKVDLHLTDTQLGLVSGIAFALFYSILGIPIARWADQGNRVTIISLTTALWSAAVALCGVATSFLQLMLVRVGVAVGEAGCIPPAHSLIADYFTRAERPRAVARYMLGAPLALMVGYFSAGWLNELYGWRGTFVILGVPGLILAALARFGLKEPRHKQGSVNWPQTRQSKQVNLPAERPSFKEICVTLWRKRAFRHLLIYFSVSYFFGYGLLQWQPAFYMRSFGLQSGQIGTWFALIYGVGCGLGVYGGGEWAARYAAGNERLQLYACAGASAFYAAFYAAAFWAATPHFSFAMLAFASVGGSLLQGPVLATLQTLAPARMRAMSIALVYLFANLIGMGLGPLAAGMLSDALQPMLGQESLRYALLFLCPGYFWAAWHLWRAGRTVAHDLMAENSDGVLRGAMS